MKIIKPCSKCPYKRGLVHTPVNPCPQCKAGGYRMYEVFTKRFPFDDPRSDKDNKYR